MTAAAPSPPDKETRRGRVWTVDEIHSCPLFGDTGWFYGLVRERGIPRLVEVYPGMGYAKAWPRWPREWWHAAQDVWHTPLRKAMYVGARTPEQQAEDERRMQHDLTNAVPWSEVASNLDAEARS